MSSSSCVVESIAALLRDSLDRLAREAPRHRARLARALCPHRVEIAVDHERLWVVGDGEVLRVLSEPPEQGPSARIATSSATILAVLDAHVTLAEAVERGQLHVVAPLSELDALREALLVYVHGGVRTRSFAPLIDRLRARAAALVQAGAP